MRLDEPHRTLTDRFGFSLVFVNDGSPVCMEFIQRYFVDLCHRTADRIRFIFFSDIDKEEFENDVRRKLARGDMRGNITSLQIILGMLPWGRRRYHYWEDDYPERGIWDELRPRGFRPVHSPERTFNDLNRKIGEYSAVPGVYEAHRFAQRLGIGRHVPCIVAFNDIGSLSVDVMPIGKMSSDEIYYHVREWVDSFYEENQRIFHYLSEVERNIEQLQKKSRIPLRKINEWQYRCKDSWKELMIIANAIFEVSSIKKNDRVDFVNLIEKYRKDYKFPSEVIREFEKKYNNWFNLKILDTLLYVEETLVDTVSFEVLHKTLSQIVKENNFYQEYCPEIIKQKNIIHERYLIIEKVEGRVSEYLYWWKKRKIERPSSKEFKKARRQWLHLIDQSFKETGFRTELKYVFDFVRQLPLSVKPSKAAELAWIEYSHYCKVDPDNQEWLIVKDDFMSIIINYVNIIQRGCPEWLIKNNVNLTIYDAIPLNNEPGSDGNIDNLPKEHPLLIVLLKNPESIKKGNQIITEQSHIQCLHALRESIKRYTLNNDEFHQMRSEFINILQKYRNQLEAKVNEIQKEVLSLGLLKKQITFEEVQKLRIEMDKYQAIVNQFVYTHKADPEVINVPISQPLVEACGFNSQDLAEHNRKSKDINSLKQEVDSTPKEEQENLEKWQQFTETVKRYSPQYALSYALRETIPQAKLEKAFNLSEQDTAKQSIFTKDVITIIQEAFKNPETINLEENIGTLLREGNIILPLLKLNESDLTKVVKVLSQDTDNFSLKFAEKTRPVEQILILIGADVIPALNYINQINNNTMVNSQTQIFSNLEQDDIIQLESSLNQIFRNIDSIGAKKSLLSNAGVNNYFIDALDFNLGISEFITSLVARFKEYKVSSQKPNYHPLISFLEYITKEPEKYNLDDKDLQIFNIVITFGKQKIGTLSTENLQSKTNLIISKIGNSEPVIGIITALPKEYVAVKTVFGQGRDVKEKGAGAGRRYWLTDIADSEGTPQTVAVTLADMGNNIAAVRATNMLNHYPTVKSIIMCGIAGGVPHPTKVEDHVRLGDIVVSNKKGIVQYDFDKESQKFTEIRAMPIAASAELIEAARYLRSNEMLGQSPWEDIIIKALQKLNWQLPSPETDILYSSEETDEIISHPEDSERRKDQPRILLGAIGSANKLLKNPQKRDLLRDQFGVKAIEMEGSGVADATWNHGIGYLVVRGICDYCDEHKSDTWQQYAAVTAAAYVRTLLSSM
ncbi:hypothetical protein WJM97_10820 [Okeanomitos corallinicola TIOX110]|uniref:Nucleoside phosphorylase domain-containing protein n=1 Tax=Okeanomitos corallinicola TIOX110 TaxID=3133117 RepID=A0ABZ2UZ08_9CYAN